MRWALLFVVLAGAAQAQSVEVTSQGAVARFEGPTDRYGHAIMGNLPEWSRLCLSHGADEACVTLPATSVFEDMAPRLADMDGDGLDDAVVVESSVSGGASLAVYRRDGTRLVRTATPPIGRRNRWLSPIGIADFDTDGRMDVAYVETPHLGKLIKIFSWDDGALTLIARASKFSNHRIGQETVSSGLRDCGDGFEMVVPSGDWTRIYGLQFVDGQLRAKELGAYSEEALQELLAC